MSGITSQQIREIQNELERASKQARLLESSTAPIDERVKAIEARQTSLYRRLRWLTLGR